jgi:integrase/recombinase XerD
MHEQPYDDLSLFSRSGSRKYLTTAERLRFMEKAEWTVAPVRLFCHVLGWSGGRISEMLALTPATIDTEVGAVNFRTLKRRKKGITRQVLLPGDVLDDLERSFDLLARQRDPARANKRLWPWSRTTGWRHVKQIMAAAGITGAHATPKGLRHGFGVSAFQAKVPPHLVQRWLGHASLRTTAIYGDVVGPEERIFAERMWK